MALPGTPPLLLTKRLNAFLHANLTPQLPNLLLTTPHGKLLAHASPQPVAVLRTHATVAASLLAIHTSSSVNVPSALPGSASPDPIASSPASDDDDEATGEDGDAHRDEPHIASKHAHPSRRPGRFIKPVTITVQLTGGTVIIRRLKCGLLFVCVGPTSSSASSLSTSPHDQASLLRVHENGDVAASPSEAESLISAGGQTTASGDSSATVNTASVAAMRRHAAALAHWLDDKLGTLQVPEEGMGVE